jgi:hypothetical protein
MPPGNRRSPARAKSIDKATAGACIDVARRVQRTRVLAGDEAGADVARQVARLIEQELVRGTLGVSADATPEPFPWRELATQGR